MLMNNTVTQASESSQILISDVNRQYVAIVVNIIITSMTENNQDCYVMLYKNSVCKHSMKFSLQPNQTKFIQSKMFLTQGDSLRVQSSNDSTVFSVMYDMSINS